MEKGAVPGSTKALCPRKEGRGREKVVVFVVQFEWTKGLLDLMKLEGQLDSYLKVSGSERSRVRGILHPSCCCCYCTRVPRPARPRYKRQWRQAAWMRRGHCFSAPSVSGGSWCDASSHHSGQTCGRSSHRQRVSRQCGCGCG